MLQIKNLFKTYKSSKGVTHRALEDVSITLPNKGLIFLLGKSGSGKSTLLNILGGLDAKDSGDVLLNKQSICSLSEVSLDAYRNTYLGFIFQEHNLLSSLNVFENVALALDLQNDQDYKKVEETLEKLDILSLKNRRITEISGGQKQRVAIARAIVKDPKIILADEPTGSLDSSTSDDIMKILKELSADRLVIVVTHDREFAMNYADRLIELKDGVVLRDLQVNDGTSHATKLEIVASSIVKIPNGYKLNLEDLTQINEVLTKTNRETYLTVEKDKDLVKAFFPHLRTAIDDSSLDKDGRFRQYHPNIEDDGENSLELKKSHLPLKRALKFGLTNLRSKRVRLILMLCLSIISISLFAIGENFATYRQSTGIAYSLRTSNDKVASIISANSDIVELSYEEIREADILRIKSLVNNRAQVFRTYEQKLDITSYKPKQNLFNGFRGFVEVNNVEELGFTYYLKDDDLASEDNAVGISKFAAEMMVKDGYVKNFNQIVNKNSPLILTIDEKEYCVSSIVDTLDDEFDALLEADNQDESLQVKHNIAASQYLYHFFVKEGFMIESFNKQDVVDIPLSTDIKHNDITQTISDIFSYESQYAYNNYSIHVFDEANKENGYVIGINAFLKLMRSNLVLESRNDFFDPVIYEQIAQLVETYNNEETYITAKKSSSLYYASKNVPIFGIAYDCSPGQVNTKLDSIGISQKEFNELSLRDKTSTSVLVRLSENQNVNANIFDILLEEGYILFSSYNVPYLGFFLGIESFASTIRLVSIGLALVVILLLYGFISSSIKSSSQDIGILRALGARFNDILRIFALETITIGFFSFIGAFIFSNIAGFVVNYIFSSSLNFSFLVINIDFTIVLKMLILTLVVVFLASVIPTHRLSKMRPVDVISKRGS